MIVIGNRDLKNIVLPSAIDAEAVALRTLPKSRITYGELLQDINDAMQEKRASVFASPFVTGMTFFTPEIQVYYRSGQTNGFEERTEYGEADEQRGDERGHMLPVKSYDRSLGWSEAFLEKASRNRLDNDIIEATVDYEELATKTILQSLFRSAALTGRQWGLGDTGKCMPFCDGGTADAEYVPPRARGKVFDYTHNHYLRQAAINQANLDAAVEHLWEHGHDAPYVLTASDADAASWRAVTNFKGTPQLGVNYGANETLAQPLDGGFVGVITTPRGSVFVRTEGRIDAGYWNLYKSYGNDDPRNPLYIFEEEEGSIAPVLKVPVARVLPIQGAIMVVQYGVGTGRDRTNSVSVKVAGSGNYTDPVNLMA